MWMSVSQCQSHCSRSWWYMWSVWVCSVDRETVPGMSVGSQWLVLPRYSCLFYKAVRSNEGLHTNTHSDTQTTSNSAGNRPDPCPFNVHIRTYYEAEKGAVKETRRDVAFGVYPAQRDRLEMAVNHTNVLLSIKEFDFCICVQRVCFWANGGKKLFEEPLRLWLMAWGHKSIWLDGCKWEGWCVTIMDLHYLQKCEEPIICL